MQARKLSGLLFCCILAAIVAAPGCGVRGSWVLKEVQPAIGNEGFTLARASFYPNDSFEAVLVRDGTTTKCKGTYDYCCCTKELVLYTGDETLVYKASRKSCRTLHIEGTTSDGNVVNAVMCRRDTCDRHKDCRQPSCLCECK